MFSLHCGYFFKNWTIFRWKLKIVEESVNSQCLKVKSRSWVLGPCHLLRSSDTEEAREGFCRSIEHLVKLTRGVMAIGRGGVTLRYLVSR